MMSLNLCLKAAQIAYDYSDEDQAAIRQIAKDDLPGLRTALQADPLLPWIAYENGIINEAPTTKEPT